MDHPRGSPESLLIHYDLSDPHLVLQQP
jgi:hypothetical protein